MPIDASIYQNARPNPIQMPSPFETAEQGMRLSQLGMQVQSQQAMRQAYANNVGPDGQLNRAGVLTDLNRINPMAGMQVQQQWSQFDKQQAEAKEAQAKAEQAAVGVALPMLQHLDTVPDEQKPVVYHQIMQTLADKGLPMHNVPPEFTQPWLDNTLDTIKKTPAYLEQQEKLASIAEKMSNVATAPAKRNAELYGSRSPNAELTSQYGKEAAPVRSSQIAMNQMIDNYKNPSPQGDASLILNAFKIKFPTAPDVNSLEELSKSQAASDQWKNMAHQALSGGLDQNTRDNLMRDGISTYRANVDSLRDIQEKYQGRARQQNVDDPTLTAEPAVDKTFSKAMELQGKIGPYVPPTERPGLLGSAAKMLGVGESRRAKGTTDQITSTSANAKPAASAGDTAAMQWLKSADPTSPEAFAIRAKLKKKGIL